MPEDSDSPATRSGPGKPTLNVNLKQENIKIWKSHTIRLDSTRTKNMKISKYEKHTQLGPASPFSKFTERHKAQNRNRNRNGNGKVKSDCPSFTFSFHNRYCRARHVCRLRRWPCPRKNTGNREHVRETRQEYRTWCRLQVST